MTVVRRVAALLTLALSLETSLLGRVVACAMPGDDDASATAAMDMAGMDMTPESQPRDDTSRSERESCSLPWSPPRDCHDMEACAPVAIATPAVSVTVTAPMVSAVLPRLLPGPRSLPHTPDPPPPRA